VTYDRIANNAGQEDLMQISSPNLIAAMLLTAFVIERATAAGGFIVSLFRLRGKDQAARDELKRTFWRTLFAGLIAAAVIYNFRWMRLLATFNVSGYDTADALLTWLVLVSGTDRLSTFIGAGADKAATSHAKEAALAVHGTLATDEEVAGEINKRATP
jgi:hypothetical protein